MLERFLTRLAARRLSRHYHASERERIRAKARALRKAMGLPEKAVLR